jgi:chemotaxis protein MotB
VKTDRETPIRIVRKRRGGHAAHHGGAWKVAFADFTTSMMALFLVLWIVSQSSDVKSAIAGYFQDPLGRASEFGSSVIPGSGAQAANVRPLTPEQLLDFSMDRLQQLGEQIRRRLEQSPDWPLLAQQVEIAVTPEGLRISLIEDTAGTFFQSGSSIPNLRGRALLQLLGAELGTASNTVVIEGHTDATPYTGRQDYSNWELSADRANTARRLLEVGGLHGRQVGQVRGYADREPRDASRPDAAANRRVTITMLAADSARVAAPAADTLRSGGH